jgi:hypothetical protein
LGIACLREVPNNIATKAPIQKGGSKNIASNTKETVFFVPLSLSGKTIIMNLYLSIECFFIEYRSGHMIILQMSNKKKILISLIL